MKTKAAVARKKVSTTQVPQRSGLPSLRKQAVILSIVLAIATIAVYFPVSHHPFLNFDDMVYVVNNPHIQSGLDWETISWAFSTLYQFNWHPLTWLSHAMDVQLYQLQPGGHHVTNLLIQVLNVLLLFWILARATGYLGRSAMVAGLFALHPVNVESVAWVSERKNLLSMFFLLLGLGAYRWYASAATETASSRKARGRRGPARGRYVVVAVLFALGLMCKPQIITFPFLLLLWDFWPLQRMSSPGISAACGTVSEPLLPVRGFWWLVKEKIPLFLMCAASAVITLVAQKAGGAMVSLQHYPFSIRLTNAIVSYVQYIGKAFWPMRLVPFYPHPWHSLPMWQVIPAGLALIGITVLAFRARERRYFLVGWLWFLGALVPMIGLVHVGGQAMADRYAYLPFIGLFIIVSWGVLEFAEARRVPMVALRVVSVVVLLALAVLTYRQLGYWNDNVTLWQHTIESSRGNYVAEDNLALLLLDRGQTGDAMQHFHAALAIDPADPTSNLNLAIYDHQHGRLREAIARYDQMLTTQPAGPTRAELLSNRGLVYVDLRDSAHARENFDAAVAMDPRNYRGWLGLGVLAVRSGDLQAAVDDFQRSVSAKPTEVAYALLAQILEQSGRSEEAKAAREKARMFAKNTLSDVPDGLMPR